MKKVIYTVSIEVESTPKDVFNHLVQLSKWWPEEYVGEHGAEIHLGSTFIFKTGDGHFSKNRVIELETDKKLAWLTMESYRKSDNFDWSGTKMIISLSSRDGDTKITFSYDGVVPEKQEQR